MGRTGQSKSRAKDCNEYSTFIVHERSMTIDVQRCKEWIMALLSSLTMKVTRSFVRQPMLSDNQRRRRFDPRMQELDCVRERLVLADNWYAGQQ